MTLENMNNLPWKTWAANPTQPQSIQVNVSGLGPPSGSRPPAFLQPSTINRLQSKSCSLPGYARPTDVPRTSGGVSTDRKNSSTSSSSKRSNSFRFFWKPKVDASNAVATALNDSDGNDSSSSSVSSSSSSDDIQKRHEKTVAGRLVVPNGVMGLPRHAIGAFGSRSCESLRDLKTPPPTVSSSSPSSAIKGRTGLAGKLDQLLGSCKGHAGSTTAKVGRKEARRKAEVQRKRDDKSTSSEDEERQWRRIRRTQSDDELASFALGRPPDNRRAGLLEARTKRFYRRRRSSGNGDDTTSKSVSPSPVPPSRFQQDVVVQRRQPPAPPSRSSSNDARTQAASNAARPPRSRPSSYAFDDRHLAMSQVPPLSFTTSSSVVYRHNVNAPIDKPIEVASSVGRILLPETVSKPKPAEPFRNHSPPKWSSTNMPGLLKDVVTNRQSEDVGRPPPRASPVSPTRWTVNRHYDEPPRRQRIDHQDKSAGKTSMDNLEEAIQELEVIYQSMKDRDQATCRSRRASSGFSSEVASDRDGGPGDSCQPDKVTDDLAFRKLKRPGSETSSNAPGSYPVGSYLLRSPALSPAISADDLHQINARSMSSADRSVFDDVTFRTMRDANQQKKVVEPQPPFGIPLGPIARAASTDYLHAKARPKMRRRFTPDVVHDDLAYRNLRKDILPPSNSGGPNFEELDHIVNVDLGQQMASCRKHIRAIKCLSANVDLAQMACRTPCMSMPTLSDAGSSRSLDDLSLANEALASRPRETTKAMAKGLMHLKRHSLAVTSMPPRPWSRRPWSETDDHVVESPVRIEATPASLAFSTRRGLWRPAPIRMQVAKSKNPAAGLPIDEGRLEELLSSLAQVGGGSASPVLHVLTGETMSIRLPLPGLDASVVRSATVSRPDRDNTKPSADKFKSTKELAVGQGSFRSRWPAGRDQSSSSVSSPSTFMSRSGSSSEANAMEAAPGVSPACSLRLGRVSESETNSESSTHLEGRLRNKSSKRKSNLNRALLPADGASTSSLEVARDGSEIRIGEVTPGSSKPEAQ